MNLANLIKKLKKCLNFCIICLSFDIQVFSNMLELIKNYGGFCLYEKNWENQKGKQSDDERFICFVLHLCGNTSASPCVDVYKLLQTK